MSYYYITRSPDYLEHHGILGMKWGVRRYQNKDGSLTPEGRARYGDVLTKKQMKNYIRDYNLVTGSDKKINKKTVFKTENGMYDYKGRKIKNTNVSVENPAEEKKTDSKPKNENRMTDDELRAANARMQLELDYRQKMAQLNPQKVSVGKQFTDNLKNDLVRDIPAGISGMIKNAIAVAGNSNPNSQKQNNEGEKKDKTPTTRVTGVNPDKMNDKQYEAYVNRLNNIAREISYKQTINNEMTREGEEFMKDLNLPERQFADINGEWLPHLLEDKKNK